MGCIENNIHHTRQSTKTFLVTCYAKVEDGLVNTYVQRVQTTNICSSGPGGPAALDANTDGTLGTSDMVQFSVEWEAGWPNTDLDGDGTEKHGNPR